MVGVEPAFSASDDIVFICWSRLRTCFSARSVDSSVFSAVEMLLLTRLRFVERLSIVSDIVYFVASSAAPKIALPVATRFWEIWKRRFVVWRMFTFAAVAALKTTDMVHLLLRLTRPAPGSGGGFVFRCEQSGAGFLKDT